MKCPNCNKSLWFVRSFCPFCKTNITAPPRPNSVTALCWILIVSSILVLFSVLVFGESVYREKLGPLSALQKVWFFKGPVLCIVLEGCTLLGHNWARWLLVVWLGINAIRSAILGIAGGNPDLTLLYGRMLLFVAAAYYLFRPQARAFFRSERAAGASTQNVSWPAHHSGPESPCEKTRISTSGEVDHGDLFKTFAFAGYPRM